MTDCSQLQSMLDTAIQLRSALNHPKQYCEDNYDTITEQELCRKRIPQQIKETEQEIALLQQQLAVCSLLVGAWNLTVTNCDTGQVLYTGQLTITDLNFVEQREWVSLFGSLVVSKDSIRYDIGDAGYDPLIGDVWFNGDSDSGFFKVYFGTVDASTQPPMMKNGFIDYTTGSDPHTGECWTAQKA